MARISKISTHMRVALALGALGAGCHEDAEPTVEKSSARQGWRSTEVALARAGIATGWTGSGSVSADGVVADLMGSVPCPDGGHMDVEAAGEVGSDGVTAELAIRFDGCEAEGVVIDGILDYEASVSETAVFAGIHGDLDWSGDAEGRCAIDLETWINGRGTPRQSVAVHGRMCGYGWQDVF
jgi:hypothetical protein